MFRDIFGSFISSDFPPDEAFGSRVGTETVGTMKGFTGSFSGCPDAFYWGSSVNVGMDATHKIVSSRPNGDWLVNRVDEVEPHRDLSNHRQPFVDFIDAKVAQVNVNIVKAIGSGKSSTLFDFSYLGAGDNVSGSYLYLGWSVLFHESFAFAVEQVAAFTTCCFCNQDTRRN